jgi:DNA-binding transcriptional MerR regulator
MMEYTDEQIEACRKSLDEQPLASEAKTKYGKADAIRLLFPEILECQNRGYTIAQIREMLSSHGIEIAHSTLSRYISDLKREYGNWRKKAKPGSSARLHVTQSSTASPPQSQVVKSRNQEAGGGTEKARGESKEAGVGGKPGSFEVFPDTDDL